MGERSNDGASDEGINRGRNEEEFFAREKFHKQMMTSYNRSEGSAESLSPPELDNSPAEEEGQETRFSKLDRMDKFLLYAFTPFLVQRRRTILALSIAFA